MNAMIPHMEIIALCNHHQEIIVFNISSPFYVFVKHGRCVVFFIDTH